MKKIIILIALSLLIMSCSAEWTDEVNSSGILTVKTLGPATEHWYGTTKPVVWEVNGLTGGCNSISYSTFMESLNGQMINYKLRRSGDMYYVQIIRGDGMMEFSLDSQISRGQKTGE